MASAMWPLSRQREYDANGRAIVGAQAYFYNVGTTTPQTVYQDSDLNEGHDQPVETDGNGRWPAVYFADDPGEYRQRVLDEDDELLFDDDGIVVPLGATYTPPEAGDTSVELLARTGDLSWKYRTGTLSGWVRAAGRTIGSATSGALERANADCEDLFELLWDQDSSLSVSGGRGANAAADWAANKTIALPDFRNRVAAGLGDMGNSNAALIANTLLDGGDTNITLGGIGGADDVVLVTANLAAHTHTAGSFVAANHGHPTRVSDFNDGDEDGSGGFMLNGQDASTYSANTGSAGNTAGDQIGGSGTLAVSGTSASSGSGTAHANLQPTMLVTVFIKL
jgi:microcystin-dependent protein